MQGFQIDQEKTNDYVLKEMKNMSEPSIDREYKWYKAQKLESFSFCELTEFRKYALWHRDTKLAKTIYNRKVELVRSGKVSSKEMIGAAYL